MLKSLQECYDREKRPVITSTLIKRQGNTNEGDQVSSLQDRTVSTPTPNKKNEKQPAHEAIQSHVAINTLPKSDFVVGGKGQFSRNWH